MELLMALLTDDQLNNSTSKLIAQLVGPSSLALWSREVGGWASQFTVMAFLSRVNGPVGTVYITNNVALSGMIHAASIHWGMSMR